ncbi:MAG: 50S ribosomal protein L24 [Firmicutes bacterium]|nr:50S ribosomal protein L24 [Bacillota bacterium]
MPRAKRIGGEVPVRKKLNVRKGDTVVVLSGKHRGRKGKVIRVDVEGRRVVVEGVNVAKKHLKPRGKVLQGGIVDQEMPIPRDKVMLVCPRCNKPARVSRTRLEDGRLARTCHRCGEIVDR